ncbi:hypothetical protein J3L18_12065 [Mucilaginibacter gossypii]|uniref:hypothetical protein n=1 Tax=Mucilaginibacter gossypii TaxID=551996 RepID=UPI0016742D7C|nr:MULTISPECIES: hypothetical protein [Mucilaginibacter]QTE39749.1 hypothetical protein J3L18_12065 [Mucilaginibacter gossypii]
MNKISKSIRNLQSKTLFKFENSGHQQYSGDTDPTSSTVTITGIFANAQTSKSLIKRVL